MDLFYFVMAKSAVTLTLYHPMLTFKDPEKEAL